LTKHKNTSQHRKLKRANPYTLATFGIQDTGRRQKIPQKNKINKPRKQQHNTTHKHHEQPFYFAHEQQGSPVSYLPGYSLGDKNTTIYFILHSDQFTFILYSTIDVRISCYMHLSLLPQNWV
jgi:hypothetical protein